MLPVRFDMVDVEMNAIHLSPTYLPLIQKPSCCAVTCLQMILFRNEGILFDQEKLAITFGVKILPQDAPAFSTTMPIMTDPAIDEGIRTVESEARLNLFFQEVAPRLKATSFKYSKIPSLIDFLTTHLCANHDIWVEYHSDDIHPTDERRGMYIHDGLVESLDLQNDRVIVIDSMPDHQQRLSLSLNALETAISTRYGRETGFILIERR
jgi:hypothetical protein